MSISKMTLAILSAVVATTACSDAFADPPPEMATINRIVGKWTGTGVKTDNGESRSIEANWSCKPELDGFAVSCSLNSDVYRAIHVFSFDAADGSFTWSIACTDALVFSLTGERAGDAIVFRDGDRADATMRFVDDQTIDITVSADLGELGHGHVTYRMIRR